jgi:hypothetical protein
MIYLSGCIAAIVFIIVTEVWNYFTIDECVVLFGDLIIYIFLTLFSWIGAFIAMIIMFLAANQLVKSEQDPDYKVWCKLVKQEVLNRTGIWYVRLL